MRVGEWRHAKCADELRGPLLAEPRRDEHDAAERIAAARELVAARAGLDRLAETDGIRDEHPGRAVPQHRERRLELIGQERVSRARHRRQRAERMHVDERAIELVQPAPRLDRSRLRRPFERDGPIERREQRQRAGRLALELCSRSAAHSAAGRDILDAPLPSAHAHARAATPAPKCGSVDMRVVVQRNTRAAHGRACCSRSRAIET